MSPSLAAPFFEAFREFEWIALFFAPSAFVVWQVVRATQQYRAEAQEPFTDLPMRLPGESSRKAAEEHFEKAMEALLFLVMAPVVFGITATTSPPPQRGRLLLEMGALAVVIAGVAGSRALNFLRRHWDCALGFKGERVVAEELNPLLSQGWRLFHDVPFGNFNVDHVAVGPLGVFAVETKTRRKWKGRRTVHPAHVVKWDGKGLTWPCGARDESGPEQAERNAKAVAGFLSKATGEDVTCRPVLTVPGWWVESEGRGAVLVASTKGLHKLLPKWGPSPLPPAQVQRIAHQLEQKCRPQPAP